MLDLFATHFPAFVCPTSEEAKQLESLNQGAPRASLTSKVLRDLEEMAVQYQGAVQSVVATDPLFVASCFMYGLANSALKMREGDLIPEHYSATACFAEPLVEALHKAMLFNAAVRYSRNFSKLGSWKLRKQYLEILQSLEKPDDELFTKYIQLLRGELTQSQEEARSLEDSVIEAFDRHIDCRGKIALKVMRLLVALDGDLKPDVDQYKARRTKADEVLNAAIDSVRGMVNNKKTNLFEEVSLRYTHMLDLLKDKTFTS